MRKVSIRTRRGHAATDVAASHNPAPGTLGETSSARARIPELVPAGWLDRLLVATLDLPLLRGERAVVEAMVEVVATIVPGCAVGLCLVPEPGAAVR